MNPSYICFSPTNWRQIAVAYQKEIVLWNLDICDMKRVKSIKKRYLLPPTEHNVEEEVVGPEFKDEYKLPNTAIAAVDDDYSDLVDEIMDKRERHSFRTMAWSNVDEFLVSSDQNYIFKVNR
jgi:hypothetical protein